MIKMKRLGNFLIVGLLLTLIIIVTNNKIAEASEVVLPTNYSFVFGSTERPTGTEYELKSSELLLSIRAEGGWSPDATITWVSSEPDVVELRKTPASMGANFIQMVRRGPGFSTITAVVSIGTYSYSLSCQVKVDLSLDIQKTGLEIAKTTLERILVLDEVGDTKPIYLKYVDTETVSGAAILANAVTFASDNEGVARVDEKGIVTAVGAGSARITVSSNTMSNSDKPMTVAFMAVVSPSFTLTYDDGDNTVEEESSPDPNTAQPVLNIPTSFVLESNATQATNLKWEVYDNSTGKKLNPTNAKLTYVVSEISGNVSFSFVKAGTYDIYAFASNDYNKDTKAPLAYMKIVVPISIKNVNLVMQVGDSYDVIANSNVPSAGIFSHSYEVGSNLIALYDKGVITARRKGHVRIRLQYLSEHKLFDDNLLEDNDIEDNFYIDIQVIDGIALSTTNTTMYTSGTLLLQALLTDPTTALTWTSSNPSIATVSDSGLVTALKAGNTTITVTQVIGGVVKKAHCQITVQQSVTAITIEPNQVTLPIGEYKTLKASFTPKSLSGVTLQWKSSNENVVVITEATATTVTIQGVAGGHAVISAINQDNVVVGYCHVSVRQSVTSITLSEKEAVVDLKTKRLQLRASVYPENAMNKEVSWTSTDPTKARVDQNGMITFLKAGTVSIIATSVDNPAVRAICNFTIQIPTASVALDEREKIMYVGEAARLSYVVLPTNASTNAVTWTSTNTSVVAIDSTGKVTAKGVGTAVIILKTVDGGHSAYCTITVRRVATNVKLDVSKLDMKVGESYQIKTEFTPKDSTEIALVWESSDTKVATVNDSGKVTAKSTGQAIIMVRTEAGGVTYCKVTVTQPVTGLIINFSEKTIYVGDKFELKASVTPSEASQLGVTWKSSNTEVATVSEKGEVVALTGGTTLITCTTVEGGFTAVCVVTVRELVSSIKLNHESLRIGKDKTVILEAIVSTQTATNKNVTWRSSNTKVATVNSKGKVTGVGYGFAIITAIAKDGSEVEASCDIEVVRPVSRITVKPTSFSMLVGETRQLKATIEPKNATYNQVNWVSSDTNIAMVDEDGYVTAISAGTVYITAEAQDDSGKKAISHVTVGNRIPSTGVTMSDKSLVMVPGESKTVQVVLNPANSTDSLSWSTDNAAVAKVDQKTGKITAVAVGSASITAMTSSGKKAVIEVTVIGLNITQLELEQYDRYQLVVNGATTRVTWDVLNPSIATVRNGQITTAATGTTTIIAHVNGRRLECKLSVVRIGKRNKV